MSLSSGGDDTNSPAAAGPVDFDPASDR
jgi:hypothetical protein